MADLLAKKQPIISSVHIERGGSFLFYISLAIFLFVAAGAGGLTLLNRAQKDALQVLTAEVEDKEVGLRSDLVNQIFLIDQRLKNLRTLLSGHTSTANVFSILEKNTLPQVRFVNFSFDTSSRKLDMSGEAASYSTIAKQIGVFERDPNIERVEFGGLSLGGNNIAGFKVSLIFKRSFLGFRP